MKTEHSNPKRNARSLRLLKGLGKFVCLAPTSYLVAFMLWQSPAALAQEEPPKPAVQTKPVPVKDLPPLKLPDIREKDKDLPTNSGTPATPAAAPPKVRPLPTGPAVVKAGIKTSGARYFKIFYDGNVVGWSRYRVSGEMSLGGTDAVILNSEGELRLGFGKVVPSKFQSRLMLDRKTLRPAYYKCQQDAGGGSFEVECVYSESMVAQTNRTGDSKTVHFHNFEDKPPQLVFNNLWGHLDTFPEHYWIMVRSATRGGIVDSYDPILRGGGDVIVYPPSAGMVNFGGRKVKTKDYAVSDISGVLLAKVRVAADTFELLEVEEVGSGLKMVKTEAAVMKGLKKLKGLDLTDSRIVESNVVFPDPEQLTTLEAELEIDLRGGQLADHRIAGYRQYFTGDIQEGTMKGRVFVRSVPREVPFDAPFPMDEELKPELKSLLKAGPGVEMDFPPLATKAREITWKSPSSFEAAKRLNGYVYDLSEGVSLPSARYALESGVGNAESKALLLVAMNRAVGLPSRKISGLVFREGNFVPHHWVEAWLGTSIGWTPFDPTTGEAGRVGASHIALLDSGDIQNLNIRVTNYAPRATKRVPFIARELQWSVGEKRRYGIYKDGKKVGTEIASVGDIDVVDGNEVYRFKAHSEVQGEGGNQTTTAHQLLTPQGLPKQIILETKDAVKRSTTTYDFAQDTVIIRQGKPGDEKYEASAGREYPFAKGTYFTEPRLLSQWALMAGQVPLTEGAEKEFPLHTFIPGRKKKKEMLLEVGELEEIVLKPNLGLGQTEKPESPEDGESGSEDRKPDSENAKASPEDSKTDDKERSEKPAGDKDPNSISGDPLAGIDTESKPEETVMATHLITDTGVEFWVNKDAQVVKIEIPEQGVELILESAEIDLKGDESK